MFKDVLVIEDNENNMNLVTDLLEHAGDFTIRTESDGDRGLTIALKNPPDLLILDIDLKGSSINGIELATQLRGKHLHRLPILVITAYDSDGLIDLMQNINAHLMTKPIGVENFLKTIALLTDDTGDRQDYGH